MNTFPLILAAGGICSAIEGRPTWQVWLVMTLALVAAMIDNTAKAKLRAKGLRK